MEALDRLFFMIFFCLVGIPSIGIFIVSPVCGMLSDVFGKGKDIDEKSK